MPSIFKSATGGLIKSAGGIYYSTTCCCDDGGGDGDCPPGQCLECGPGADFATEAPGTVTLEMNCNGCSWPVMILSQIAAGPSFATYELGPLPVSNGCSGGGVRVRVFLQCRLGDFPDEDYYGIVNVRFNLGSGAFTYFVGGKTVGNGGVPFGAHTINNDFSPAECPTAIVTV